MARTPKGPSLVEGIEGDPLAKQKLKVILATIAGSLSVAEACAELSIGEARFHQLRGEWLYGAAKLLEPKPAGRPRKVEEAPPADVERLQDEAARLRRELAAERIRADIATTMPHVLQRAMETVKKKATERVNRWHQQ